MNFKSEMNFESLSALLKACNKRGDNLLRNRQMAHALIEQYGENATLADIERLVTEDLDRMGAELSALGRAEVDKHA